ncbi:hypothetical protein ACPV5S_01345 [Vibrio astriarenae]
MATNIFKLTAFTGIVMSLAGCTSNPAIFGTPQQITMLNGEDYAKYDLSEETFGHSDAMQLMYLTSRQSVKSSNNLDRNVDGYRNDDAVRATQAATVAGVATASLNPFQAAFRVVGMQGSISKMNWRYRRNVLIKMIPIDSTDEAYINQTLEENQRYLTNIISQAYLQLEDVSQISVIHPRKDGLSLDVESHVVLPLEGNGDVSICADKNLNRRYIELMNDEEFVPKKMMPISVMRCYGWVEASGRYYRTEGNNNNYIPNQDFLLMTATLPDIFPHHLLESDDEYVFLYQAAMSYMTSNNLEALLKQDINSAKPYWEDGYFTAEPFVTQISTSKILPFGQVKL